MAEDPKEPVETAPEPEPVAATEPSEFVKRMIEKHAPPTKEPTAGEETPPVSEEKPPVEAPPPEPTITEEMVKNFPYAKTLIGKPITELFKSQDSLLRTWNRDRQELAELKKQKTAPVQEKLPTLEEFVQKGLDDAKIELPDPVDDKKGFDAAMGKRLIKRQELIDEWRSKQRTPEKEASERRVAEEKVILDIRTTQNLLMAKIPGKTVEEINQLSVAYRDELGQVLIENPKLYVGKPELLAADIAFWYASSELKRQQEETKNKVDNAKKNTTQKVKAALADQNKNNTQSVKEKEGKKEELSVNTKKILERAERQSRTFFPQ